VNTVTDQLAVDHLEGEETSVDAPDTGDDVPPADGAPAPRLSRRGRVSKWDRPPDPHDWRYFVGTIGKILIATGVLLFGFVGYQLWGTGIETARAQNRLENQFEAQLTERSPAAPLPATEPDVVPRGNEALDQPDVAVTDVDPVADGAVASEDNPATAEPPVDGAPVSASERDGPAIPIAQDLSDQAIIQDLPPVIRGEAIARLEIPRINEVQYVLPGVNIDDLKKGPGHYPDTPLPGQLGNASIAGHRTTYGAPFFDVDQLQASDELIVTMANGDAFVYEVTFTEVVAATDYYVVATTDPSIAELTLTSCHPKYTARERIVVHSVLNVEKSAQVGLPTFYDLGFDPADDLPIPGDDPVLGASAPAPDDAVPDQPVFAGEDPANEGGVIGAIPASDEEGPAAPQAANPQANLPEASVPALGAGFSDRPQGDAEDAFARGWFHDMDAFPQIALWGAILALIAIASYLISRRFRHDSIGLLVGFAPFMFTLYFFFQNVHRLLPPGL
jgi:sortase A